MIDIPRSARIYVAGHRGLVGSAILRHLRAEGYDNLLTATRDQLDLRDQAAVNYWFRANRPEYVFQWPARWAASWPTRRGRRSSSTTT